MLTADLSRVVVMSGDGGRGVRWLHRRRSSTSLGDDDHRVSGLPAGSGRAAAAARRVAGGVDRRERQLDGDRKRGRVLPARRWGGMLLATTSVGWVFVADALTLVWSALFVVCNRVGARPRPHRRSRARHVAGRSVGGFSALLGGARRPRRGLPLLLPDGRRGRNPRADRGHGARPARHREFGPGLPQRGARGRRPGRGGSRVCARRAEAARVRISGWGCC